MSICHDFTDSIDRYQIDEDIRELQELIEDDHSTKEQLLEALKYIQEDFDTIFDKAYTNAKILDNFKTELD